ncbi:hypothetical protein AAZX31_10G002200 [Glycine max]
MKLALGIRITWILRFCIYAFHFMFCCSTEGILETCGLLHMVDEESVFCYCEYAKAASRVTLTWTRITLQLLLCYALWFRVLPLLSALHTEILIR